MNLGNKERPNVQPRQYRFFFFVNFIQNQSCDFAKGIFSSQFLNKSKLFFGNNFVLAVKNGKGKCWLLFVLRASKIYVKYFENFESGRCLIVSFAREIIISIIDNPVSQNCIGKKTAVKFYLLCVLMSYQRADLRLYHVIPLRGTKYTCLSSIFNNDPLEFDIYLERLRHQ